MNLKVALTNCFETFQTHTVMKMLMTSSKLQKRNQIYERIRVLEKWLGLNFGGSCVLFSCPVIVKSFSNGNEISLDPYYCLALMVICNNHYALPPCMYLCSQIVQKCMTKWEKIQSNIPDTLAKWDLFSCSCATLGYLKKSEAAI